MDMSSLPSQHTKVYHAIDYDNIMFLYDYHPWDAGKNPKIDKITNTLLNLKHSEPRRRAPAVKFFSKVLTNTNITSLLDSEIKAFCIVPSHTANHVSQGLVDLLTNIRVQYEFQNTDNLLRRTKTILKAATGGPRNQQVHIDSIVVTDADQVRGKTVYLFDDITTTGSSLKACKSLLLAAGASRVVMIALGQTHNE